MAAKDASVLLVDVGNTISEHGEGSTLNDLRDTIYRYFQNKILYNPKHEVGVVLFGTEETKNHVNEEQAASGLVGYERIYELHPVSIPTVASLRSIKERVVASPHQGDLVDALLVAISMIHHATSKKKYNKSITVFTDGQSPMAGRDDIRDTLLQQLNEHNIELNIIGLDFSEDIESLEELPARTDIEETQLFLQRLVNDLTNKGSSISPVTQFSDIIADMKTRSVLQRPTFTGSLEIGPACRIAVRAFTKTLAAKFPTFSKVTVSSGPYGASSSSAAAGGEDGEDQPMPMYSDVKMTRELSKRDDSGDTVDKSQMMKGYKYGKHTIALDPAAATQLKIPNLERLLTCLLFAHEDQVKRHFFMSSTQYFIADPASEPAKRAFSTLVTAMINRKSVMICRYVRQKNADPKLVALLPVRKPFHDALYFTELPTSDDLREYTFKAFNKDSLKQEQLRAAEDLINSMDLTLPKDVPEEREDKRQYTDLLNPKDVFNPQLQSLYQALVTKALYPSAPIPDLPPKVLKYLYAEGPGGIIHDKLQEGQAPNRIKRFATLFPTKIVDKEAGKKKKAAWIADDAKEGMLGDESKRPKMEEGAPGAISIEFGASAYAASGLIDRVSVDNAVNDFNAMIKRTDADVFASAAESMTKAIGQMVDQAETYIQYQTALDALDALRKGCKASEAPEYFNPLIRLIKKQGSPSFYHRKRSMNSSFSEDDVPVEAVQLRRKEFWNLIQSSGRISLIHSGEVEESTVSPSEAVDFLTSKDDEEPVVEEQPAAAAEEPEEDLDALMFGSE